MCAICCCEVRSGMYAVVGQACGESVVTAHSSFTGTCEVLLITTNNFGTQDADENMQLLWSM